mmetsp:Transcript_45379/g.135682  ORF Transcript_45379/g.135682 Transcript_45379/m.135682 type:complete len:275 (+) Transcript_45379:178-1002(+)
MCSARQSFAGRDKREVELICGVCWPCADMAECDRDWHRPCPHGFRAADIPTPEYRRALGPVCVAESDYDGPCEQRVRFTGILDKQLFAERCRASWPCKRHCEKSVLSMCPVGWAHIGDSICAAPANFKVPGCHLLATFAGWSAAMKTEFAETCGVEWPCVTDQDAAPEPKDGPLPLGQCSELDLSSSACPRSWARKGTFCLPPARAEGRCAVAVDFTRMVAEEKLRWASECLASWPCVGEAPAADQVRPRRAFEAHFERAGPLGVGGDIMPIAG